MASSSNVSILSPREEEKKENKDSEHHVLEMNTIECITSKGQWLGSGSFASAYKINNKVYKIYRRKDFDPSIGKCFDLLFCDACQEEKIPNMAQRNAKYWNLVYEHIYDGKYKNLATARVIKLPSIKRGRFDVVVTPFIDGGPINYFPCSSDRRVFAQALKKISMGMTDIRGPGNLKKIKTGDILPVDFDTFHPLPIRHDVFSYAYYGNSPPSPGTRHWSREEHTFVLFLDKKSKPKKEADVFGYRSIFMRP